MFSSMWMVCDSQNLRFIKEEEAEGLLSTTGKIPIHFLLLI